jgi:hypothetical protein
VKSRHWNTDRLKVTFYSVYRLAIAYFRCVLILPTMAAYARQSVKELKALLRNRGLKARCPKDDLIQRLLEDDDCIDSNAVLRADDAVMTTATFSSVRILAMLL